MGCFLRSARWDVSREFGSETEEGEFIRYGMQNPPKHSVTGTKARETEIGIQVEIQGGAPPIKGMPLGARSL